MWKGKINWDLCESWGITMCLVELGFYSLEIDTFWNLRENAGFSLFSLNYNARWIDNSEDLVWKWELEY